MRSATGTLPRVELPVPPPVEPMLARATKELPADDGLAFEPKWDGFRCLVFRDGPEIELASRTAKDLTRYFPEMLDPLRAALPQRCVVDGELLVPGPEGLPSFEALSARIHSADSRVRLLSASTPATFVAFDLLALDDHSLLDVPLRERRTALEAALAAAARPVLLTPQTTDRAAAEDWVEHLHGPGVDGVMAKPLGGTYVPGKRTQWKVKPGHTADCVVAGYRLHKDGAGVGSLLLGLFDDTGRLHHVGAASSFDAATRPKLLAELTPLTEGVDESHPWLAPLSEEEGAAVRRPGGVSRWGAQREWEPLRIERVAEVAYDHAGEGRFRHTTKLVRWRPDREPSSCRLDQLEGGSHAPLRALFVGPDAPTWAT